MATAPEPPTADPTADPAPAGPPAGDQPQPDAAGIPAAAAAAGAAAAGGPGGDGGLWHPEMANAFRFSFFNALGFTITLGSPAILYASSLGAGATVLGVITALTPLLNVLQLPSAYFLPRFGYRRFILAGWSLRSLMVVALAGVPLLGFVDPPTRLVLMLLFLFIFNALRGFSAAAWLPWIAELVPAGARGRYVSRDQLSMNLGALTATGVSALILGSTPRPWKFSVVFAIAAAAAIISLGFILKIPDVGAAAPGKRSSGLPVPWGAMLRFPPFRKLLTLSLFQMLTLGGLGTFGVAFQKTALGFAEGTILTVTMWGSGAALLALNILGHLADRTGSKPILRLSMGFHLAGIGGLLAIALGLLPGVPPAMGALYFVFGLAGASFGVGHARIALATMPAMGRDHFFALFTVINSLGLALSPILWGLLIDGLRAATTGAGEYAVYFGCVLVLAAASIPLINPLHERAGAPLDLAIKDLLVVGGIRRFFRSWGR